MRRRARTASAILVATASFLAAGSGSTAPGTATIVTVTGSEPVTVAGRLR